MPATLWVLLTVAGFALLTVMSYIKQATLRAIAVRGAAFSFVGAGTIGAAGLIGALTANVIAWVNGVGTDLGRDALGTGALWIVWLFLSIAWLLTMLPESWFGRDIPDWLSVSGLFLPALCVSIPGPVGEFFRAVFDAIGEFMVTAARNLIGAG